jgi:cbb3-type cytochrome oxidase subunit 1
MINKQKLRSIIRVLFTAITGLLFIFGLLSANRYNKSTYGCQPTDYIAPDMRTAIITLIISLVIGVLFFINLTGLLKRKTTSHFYDKYWFQTLLLIVMFGIWFVASISSPQAWSKWCLF